MDVKKATVEIRKYPFGIVPNDALLGVRLYYLRETVRYREGNTQHIELLDPQLNILYIFAYSIEAVQR